VHVTTFPPPSGKTWSFVCLGGCSYLETGGTSSGINHSVLPSEQHASAGSVRAARMTTGGLNGQLFTWACVDYW